MEDTTIGIESWQERLHMAEQVAHVERSQEETREFVAEQHRLIAAQSKLLAKAAALHATESITLVATLIAAICALTAAAPVLARWFGQG